MTGELGGHHRNGECRPPYESEQVQQFPTEDREDQQLVTLFDGAIALALPVSPAVAGRLETIRKRLMEGRLQLAVLGQFKRGKSTLVNALLGAAVLPTGVVPLTAIPTFISWGARPRIIVTYNSARAAENFDIEKPESVRDILFKFVAEEANPENVREVKRVDLFYPSPLLERGVVLIDTPGVGSTHQHNTDAALNVLPECDAAIFVTSADPPVTEAELAYLKTAYASAPRMYFVLNKADHLDQQDLETAVSFLRKLLRSVTGEAEPTVYCVSALPGLQAKQNGDAAALTGSGIAQVEEFLLASVEREKLALLRSAVRQRAMEQVAEAEADVRFKIRTLEMPIEDLEERGAKLDYAVARIMEDGNAIHDLLEGDRRRITQDLEDHAQRLREKSRRRLSDVLSSVLKHSDRGDPEIAVQHEFSVAVPAFFEEAFQISMEKFGHITEETLSRRSHRVDELVNSVRRTAADLFDVPFVPSSGSERFTLHHEPYWVAGPGSETLISLPAGLIERLLPKPVREARRRKQLEERIAELAQRNVENLRWATRQGIDGTFRKFGVAVGERLATALEATQGAVEAASTLRTARSEGSAVELAQLRRVIEGFGEIRSAIASAVTESGP